MSVHLNADFPPLQGVDPIDVHPGIIPTTSHQAYCIGRAAGRRGDDLATVIYDAAMLWPLADIHLWCELVASASLGYWFAETGEGGGR